MQSQTACRLLRFSNLQVVEYILRLSSTEETLKNANPNSPVSVSESHSNLFCFLRPSISLYTYTNAIKQLDDRSAAALRSMSLCSLRLLMSACFHASGVAFLA